MNELKQKILWTALVLVLLTLSSQAQVHTNERAEWFTEARFGMFIHWGVYSGAEGIWKGEKLRNDNDYAEWIYYRNRIARDEYITLLDRFEWESIDPEQWVLLAKKAGMKYVTLTAKHHDGFALWDSQVSDYDVAEFTQPKRDIVKELADACNKHGLKLGLYYSHWVDWEHPDGWDHSKEIYGISAEEYDRYWQGKVIPQIRELLTNYGDVGLLWFDMWVHHSRTCVTKEQLLQLKGLIRELQPNCLVNSRLGLSIEEDSDIDYKTLGDNQLGSKKEKFPWQSPATVAHSWGFHALEKQWKSTTTLLQNLIGNVSLNGNMMLNIGPRANGDVPFEIEQRLLAMGKWLSINGESIYGSQAFDLVKDQHDWGKITCRKNPDGSTKLYLHIYNWPLSHKLPVTGIQAKPVKAYLLADPEKAPLTINTNGVVTVIDLPEKAPDLLVSVVVLEYESYPDTEDGLVAQSVYGGFSLTPGKALESSGATFVEAPSRRGTVPAHIIVSEKSSYQWRIYVNRPMSLHADVSYSFQGEAGKGTVEVSSQTGSLKAKFTSSGMFVGEPNSNWQIDSFHSHRLGQLEFTEPGYYTITLEVKPGKDEEIGFQWLWLGGE
ncbi:MAG: alpha-L-fucosidase [Bacteroidota bacterium]|nr:alpha-L-fucosidase [Bacteroidota bacterium]